MAENRYTSGVTPQAMVLSLLPLSVAAYLIWVGADALPRFGPSDPSVWLMGYLPVLLGALILLVTVASAQQNMGIRVTVTSSWFTWNDGRREFTCRWSELTVRGPEGRFVRTLTLSDGRQFGRLVDIFFPGFDDVARKVQRYRNSSQSADRRRP